MSVLNRETQNVQNPALGAMLLWRFAVGYEAGSGVVAPTPAPLMFIVISVLTQEQPLRLLRSTKRPSGLRNFASKFAAKKESMSDVLLSLHSRSLNLRSLTHRAIQIAVSTGLIGVVPTEGGFAVLSSTFPKFDIPKSVSDLMTQSEKFGYWCGQLSMHEISAILKIGF